MSLEYPWTDSETSNFLKILSLPTLEWVKPFLVYLDLPDQLLKHPQVWQSIYTEAASHYQICIESYQRELAAKATLFNFLK